MHPRQKSLMYGYPDSAKVLFYKDDFSIRLSTKLGIPLNKGTNLRNHETGVRVFEIFLKITGPEE